MEAVLPPSEMVFLIMPALETTFSPLCDTDNLVYPVSCPPKIDIGNKSVCHPLMALAGKLLGKSLLGN